jgi:hypothetical protein
MPNTALTVLVVLALLLALVSLAVAVVALRAPGVRRRSGAPVPTDVAGLRDEVERLRTAGSSAVQHLAVVRYDAFGDMGGRLSWSMALVDGEGNGVVLTSIHGRSEARAYAKTVSGWLGEQQLSPEEEEALAQLKGRPAAQLAR